MCGFLCAHRHTLPICYKLLLSFFNAFSRGTNCSKCFFWWNVFDRKQHSIRKGKFLVAAWASSYEGPSSLQFRN